MFYVDGCNLFNGMRECHWRDCYWLNLWSLAESQLREGQILVGVKYFTARVKSDPDKLKRHTTYIDAVRGSSRVQVIEGRYQAEPVQCRNCHHRWSIPKEKKTDVNIATSMVMDVFNNVWDVAFLVSGDADLVPPVDGIRAQFQNAKKIVVLVPPKRSCAELQGAANAHVFLNRKTLLDHQLEDEVAVGSVRLKRPAKWC